MKYSEDIIKQILSELEKVPNVRYVCSKVGIDHSTFYRWLMKFPTLSKQVISSTLIGKQAICGTAESMIIKGVQSGDFRACTFYLSNHDPNYMSKDKGRFFAEMHNNRTQYVSTKTKLDGSNFESIFVFLDKLALTHGEETCGEFGKMAVDLLCNNDPDLIELYHKSYEYWKMQKITENAAKEAFDDDLEAEEEALTSPTNPSSIKTCNKFTQEPKWDQEQKP